jgi:hypothetical protein
MYVEDAEGAPVFSALTHPVFNAEGALSPPLSRGSWSLIVLLAVSRSFIQSSYSFLLQKLRFEAGTTRRAPSAVAQLAEIEVEL